MELSCPGIKYLQGEVSIELANYRIVRGVSNVTFLTRFGMIIKFVRSFMHSIRMMIVV